jgi:uroporphyrinogen-III decarboxylase
MTGRERILAVLSGQKYDHLPCMPITMMFAADILGVKYGQYVRDHRILADAQFKTAEIFAFDHVSVISDPAREAIDYGAKNLRPALTAGLIRAYRALLRL